MKRLIDRKLLEWKDLRRRKPLVVRGARQVGKTYSVQQLGREHFDDIVTVDLERNRNWHAIFAGSLAAQDLLAALEVAAGTRIRPGSTLLFLDEVQACPRALLALRYLHEERPELHVVAAGSLLELALREVSVPVGRIQYLEMHPMTFAEYLWAMGNEQAAGVVLGEPRRVSPAVHEMLLDELRKYCFVGGMPESVAACAATGSIQESFVVQRELCEGYRQDFAKYAARADPDCLDAVLLGAARDVGRQIKYTRLAEGYSGPTTKRAFELLGKARVLAKVSAASPAGLPLGATASARRFKALLLDVGLWQCLCGLRADVEYARSDLLDIHQGAMAEQFVGQELLAAQDSELFYWSRDARGSSAEVDYLAVVGTTILPVEVKSGAAGRLRSMHVLLETYPNCPAGLVFSSAPYSELPEQRLSFLPLYYAYTATRRRTET